MPIFTPFDDHRIAAFFACNIGLLGFCFDIAHLRVCAFEFFRKRFVEFGERLSPRLIASGNRLEAVFHIFGVFDFEDIGEALDEHVGDEHAEFGRCIAVGFFFDVFSIENRVDRCRQRRRAPDAAIFELFDKRRLGVALRRLRIHLFWLDFFTIEHVAFFDIGQRHFLRIAALFVDILVQQNALKPRESRHSPRNAIRQIAIANPNRRHIRNGRCHLRGDETAPNQVI